MVSGTIEEALVEILVAFNFAEEICTPNKPIHSFHFSWERTALNSSALLFQIV